ncbi:MAG: hypothetical protein HC906_18220 [Bacteroidales bacterium]|nr:hypothetical protein [Bacteroidales bacterium]
MNTNSLSSNTVLSLINDFDDNLWIGTFKGGLSIYEIKNNRFVKPTNILLKSKNIRNFALDSKGRIYISSYGEGIFCI